MSWPDDHRPERCPVSSFNELAITAPIEVVWRHLIRATEWPACYGNAKNIVIDGAAELGPGVLFHWTTFGLRVHTTVREFEPERRLAWFGSGYGSSGYHTWTLAPTATGCHVVTEETQRGFLPSIGRWYIRGALHKQHQLWLEGLARVSIIAA